MFVELGAVALGTYGYRRWVNRDVYCIKKELKRILEDNKLDCYTIIDVKRVLPWGYLTIVSLNGKGFEKLQGIKDNIETKLGYETYIEQNENLKTATVKVIILPITDNMKFKPYMIKPYEIYCGLSYTYKELVVDLRKFPHCLISGQTGSGKSFLISLILTNLIYNYTDRDVNLYFSDLSDMSDFSAFKKCKQTKGYIKDMEDSLKLFEYLSHMYSKRLEIFEKNNCKNIQEYNEKFYKKRMAYNYVIMDEFADYFPVSKLEKDYQLKLMCYNYLKNFARKMRKVGTFLIIGIQRPDTTVLDPNLRSCLCTKIGFSQNSDASSLTVCDTTELTNIENRKALLTFGNTKEWFRSLYIDDNVIREYIKSSVINGSREVMDDYNKFIPKKESKKSNINEKSLPLGTILKKEKISEDKKVSNKPTHKTKTKVRVKKNVE